MPCIIAGADGRGKRLNCRRIELHGPQIRCAQLADRVINGKLLRRAASACGWSAMPRSLVAEDGTNGCSGRRQRRDALQPEVASQWCVGTTKKGPYSKEGQLAKDAKKLKLTLLVNTQSLVALPGILHCIGVWEPLLNILSQTLSAFPSDNFSTSLSQYTLLYLLENASFSVLVSLKLFRLLTG